MYMNGLTSLGRGFSPSMGNSEGYSRNDGRKFSSPAFHQGFPKNLSQFSQEDDEDLPNVLERLKHINTESHLPFEREDNFKNLSMGRHDNMYFKAPLSANSYFQEPLSNSFNNNRISLSASIFGNDALQFMTTLQGIISSPEEYQRHKENGTLPTDRDFKSIEENMLRQLQKLTSEKANTASPSEDTFGGLKNMFQQGMQQKNTDIQKLMGGVELNTSSQDVAGLQEALKSISGL